MATELAKAFYAKSKLVLVEPLGSTLQLGSVGYFSRGQWVEIGTTSSMFGLGLTKRNGSDEPNSFDAKGGNGFSFQVKAKGELSDLVPQLGDAKARAEVQFGSKDGYVFSVRNQRVASARQLAEVLGAIRWAYHYRRRLPEGRRWEKRYAVIVGVASAESAIAVVSDSSNAAIVVEGSGALKVPQTPAELDAKMKITRTRESTQKLWLGPASGYAVQALQLDPSIWKRWDREDAKYMTRAARAVTTTPRRPPSYAGWAEEKGFADPVDAKAMLLKSDGSRARAVKASSLNAASPAKARASARTRAGAVPRKPRKAASKRTAKRTTKRASTSRTATKRTRAGRPVAKAQARAR